MHGGKTPRRQNFWSTTEDVSDFCRDAAKSASPRRDNGAISPTARLSEHLHAVAGLSSAEPELHSGITYPNFFQPIAQRRLSGLKHDGSAGQSTS
jgi:hypothetical protein